MVGQSRVGAGAAALWAGVGAVLAWLAFSWLDDERVTADATALDRRATAERATSGAAEDSGRTEASGETAPRAERKQLAGNPRDNELADPPGATTASNPIVANAPPSNSPSTPTDLPSRRDGDSSTAAPAAALLALPRISCDFAAGNNTGLRQGDLLTVGGGAQWRGGLLTFDFTDGKAGTARLTGTPSVTGSPNGEAEVQVLTEGSRVFLTGFLQDRAYVVVTIFDELDYVGRHIAVMSRHDASFSYASQFLGTCE